MVPFSPTAGSLGESETLVITAKAGQMRAAGIDVAPFAAGEPDFDTPEPVREAAIAAIRAGRTKYAPAAGIPALREAVAATCRANGLAGASAAGTVISVGAKGALYLALQVLLEPGDEVIVPTPAWLSYPKMVQAAAGRTVFVEAAARHGFAIDPLRVRAAITPRTRALILNSPGNPTGAVQPDEVQAALGRIAVEHDLVVISDEIYEHLVYAPARFRSFPALAPEAASRTLVVNGVSKSYAMTGWRVGWACGPLELVARMIRLQSHATSGTPGFCQQAALAALEGPQEAVAAMRAVFAHRRDVMFEALGAIDGLACERPDGAFYVLPDVAAFYGRRHRGEPVRDGTRLAELLLEEARAAVVPGAVFEAPHAIRLSYACSEDHIRRGVARIGAFLQSLE